MEYPKYKEISEKLDEYRAEKNEPKMWVIKKLFIYAGTCFILAFIKSLFDKAKEEASFNRKYKTVIKENWLGVKSFEYHERD